MGRRPKPTELKILEGNPGKRKLNKREPKPTSLVPACPAHLKGIARQAWLKYSGELYRLKLMTNVDTIALEGLCVAVARALKADRILEKEGFTIRTIQGNVIQRCEVSISKSSWEAVRKFLSEFGMTPAARSRIQMEIEEIDPEEEALDREFFRPRG